MKNNVFKYVSINIISLWLILFCALPLLLIFSLSFFSSNDKLIFSLPLTLKNFNILFEPFFYKVLWRSIATACASTFFCFIIAYPFSFFLAQAKNRDALLILVLIPFWTSSLIRTYALVGLLKSHGLINHFLIHFKIINQPIEMMYNQTAVIIGLTYNLLPFMILPLYNVFNKLDNSIINAGKDLNASNLYIFKKIIWPISLPGVRNSMLMIFFPAMTTFYIPTILGGAKSMLLGNLIENQFLLLNDWPGGATTSFIIAGLMLLSIMFSKKEVV